MNTTETITKEDGLLILAIVRNKLGRKYKAAIRQAWITGNYDAENLSPWSGELQQLRNSFGPSWLVSARP